MKSTKYRKTIYAAKDEKSTNITNRSNLAPEEESSYHRDITLIESVFISKEVENQYNYYIYGTLEEPSEANQANTLSELKEIERTVSSINFHLIDTIWQYSKSKFSETHSNIFIADKNTKCRSCNKYLVDNPGVFSVIIDDVFCGNYQSGDPSCAKTAMVTNHLPPNYAYSLPLFLFVTLKDIMQVNHNEIEKLNRMRVYMSFLYCYYEPIYIEKLNDLTTELKLCTSDTARYNQLLYNKKEVGESLPKLGTYLKNLNILFFCKKNPHFIIPDSAISNLRKLGTPQLSELINTQNIENVKRLILIINFATDDEIQKVNTSKINENYWSDFLRNNNMFSNKLDEFPSNKSPIDSLTISKSIHTGDYPLTHIAQDIFPILTYENLSLDKSCLIISELKTKNGSLDRNLNIFLKTHIENIQTSNKEELQRIIASFNPELEKFTYMKEEKEAERSIIFLSNELMNSENSNSSFLENFNIKQKKEATKKVISLCPRRISSQRKLAYSGKTTGNKEEKTSTILETSLHETFQKAPIKSVESNEKSQNSKKHIQLSNRKKIFSNKDEQTYTNFKPSYIEMEGLNLTHNQNPIDKKREDVESWLPQKHLQSRNLNPNSLGPSNIPVIKSTLKVESPSLSSSVKKTQYIEGKEYLECRKIQPKLETNRRAKTEYREKPHYQEHGLPDNYIDYEHSFTSNQWSILINTFGETGANTNSSINTNIFLNENQNFTNNILILAESIPDSQKDPTEFILFIINSRNEFTKIDQPIHKPFSNTTYTPRPKEISSANFYPEGALHTLPYSAGYENKNTEQSNSSTIFFQKEFPSKIRELEPMHLSKSRVEDPNETALDISLHNKKELEDLRSTVSGLNYTVENLMDKVIKIEESNSNQLYNPGMGEGLSFTQFIKEPMHKRSIGKILKQTKKT